MSMKTFRACVAGIGFLILCVDASTTDTNPEMPLYKILIWAVIGFLLFVWGLFPFMD